MVGIVDLVYNLSAIFYNNTIASSGWAVALRQSRSTTDVAGATTVGLDKPANLILNTPSPIP